MSEFESGDRVAPDPFAPHTEPPAVTKPGAQSRAANRYAPGQQVPPGRPSGLLDDADGPATSAPPPLRYDPYTMQEIGVATPTAASAASGRKPRVRRRNRARRRRRRGTGNAAAGRVAATGTVTDAIRTIRRELKHQQQLINLFADGVELMIEVAAARQMDRKTFTGMKKAIALQMERIGRRKMLENTLSVLTGLMTVATGIGAIVHNVRAIKATSRGYTSATRRYARVLRSMTVKKTKSGKGLKRSLDVAKGHNSVVKGGQKVGKVVSSPGGVTGQLLAMLSWVNNRVTALSADMSSLLGLVNAKTSESIQHSLRTTADKVAFVGGELEKSKRNKRGGYSKAFVARVRSQLSAVEKQTQRVHARIGPTRALVKALAAGSSGSLLRGTSSRQIFDRMRYWMETSRSAKRDTWLSVPRKSETIVVASRPTPGRRLWYHEATRKKGGKFGVLHVKGNPGFMAGLRKLANSHTGGGAQVPGDLLPGLRSLQIRERKVASAVTIRCGGESVTLIGDEANDWLLNPRVTAMFKRQLKSGVLEEAGRRIYVPGVPSRRRGRTHLTTGGRIQN